ncbi:MAG: ankyrin repeat domain-containing protein [Acidobacteria bacterium]|nr:ankyrin repeat domain-containing protein [Acidobacteriota bacterium]
MLLAAGANADVADGGGQTPLMLSARGGSVETIRSLLAAGARASVNAKDLRGLTALTHAVEGAAHARVEKVKLLLAAGAEVGVRDNQGRTALMIAKKVGDETVVRLLEEAGARQ